MAVGEVRAQEFNIFHNNKQPFTQLICVPTWPYALNFEHECNVQT